MHMYSINLSKSLLVSLHLLAAVSLTACGGDNALMTQTAPAYDVNGGSITKAPQTAPAIAVVPQSNFNKNGSVDTAKVQAAQTNYQNNLGVTK